MKQLVQTHVSDNTSSYPSGRIITAIGASHGGDSRGYCQVLRSLTRSPPDSRVTEAHRVALCVEALCGKDNQSGRSTYAWYPERDEEPARAVRR